jgi:hypothetical protein
MPTHNYSEQESYDGYVDRPELGEIHSVEYLPSTKVNPEILILTDTNGKFTHVVYRKNGIYEGVENSTILQCKEYPSTEFILTYIPQEKGLYCVCEALEDNNAIWIECKDCGNWYHPECVDVTYDSDTVTKEESDWICPICLEE